MKLDKLLKIQQELKAPKSQRNSFGNYNYRSCEDILEALKPILNDNKVIINITDEIALIGDRFYVKATATLLDVTGEIIMSSNAFAREEEQKKGQDGSQITGSSSSYARKYALNGLLAIDDNKDSDSTNKHGKEENKPVKEKETRQATDAQLTFLRTLATKKATSDDFIKMLNDKFGINQIPLLSTVQATKLIEELKAMPDRAK
jgi:hypothetical protein